MDNYRRHILTANYYANNPKEMVLITPADERILKNPQRYFTDANKFGFGPFYATDGCSKVWAPVDSALIDKSYIWIFDTPHFYEDMSMKDRVNAIINPSAVPMVEPTLSPTVINTRYGDFMFIDIPTLRKVIGLSVKQ